MTAPIAELRAPSAAEAPKHMKVEKNPILRALYWLEEVTDPDNRRQPRERTPRPEVQGQWRFRRLGIVGVAAAAALAMGLSGGDSSSPSAEGAPVASSDAQPGDTSDDRIHVDSKGFTHKGETVDSLELDQDSAHLSPRVDGIRLSESLTAQELEATKAGELMPPTYDAELGTGYIVGVENNGGVCAFEQGDQLVNCITFGVPGFAEAFHG